MKTEKRKENWSLRHLHIYVNIAVDIDLHAFLSQFMVLETLDIQNRGVYLEQYCPDELLNSLKTETLRHLSIQQTSFDSYGICREQCDLDKINAKKSQHITYLDLSQSKHVVIKGNFFIAFPRSKNN